MSRITAEAQTVLGRVARMAVMLRSVERHRLEDQHDAVLRAAAAEEGRSGGGIADPTAALVAVLAPFAAEERRLLAGLRAVDNALDELERQAQRAIAGQSEQPTYDELRCPGWNAELRARYGGCGKPIEHWTDAEGRQRNRSTLLCISCRKAEERASTTNNHPEGNRQP